jgi:hypothetical protein
MTRVRIDLFASLDGYTSAGQTPDNPMGADCGGGPAPFNGWAARRPGPGARRRA